MWRRLIPILLLVALVAVACGDDESVFEQGGATTTTSIAAGEETTTTGAQTTTTEAATTTTEATTTLGGGEQAMADQIAADLVAEGGETDLPIDEASAQCLGNQIVATFGLARLQELDAAAGGEGDIEAALEQMTPEEQAALMGVILNGADGQAPCVDVPALIVDGLTESGISAGSAECVAGALTEGTMLQGLLGSLVAGSDGEGEMDSEVMTQLLTVLMTCLTPEELAEMMGEMGDLDLGS